jgi:hypothetical protein
MKYSFYIIACSFLFFICSCNSDSPIDGNNSDANFYNWSVIDVSMDSVYKISAGSEDVAFIAGNSCYKVTGTSVERINFQDTSFKCWGVDAYDKNTAVFWGGSPSGGSALKLKIFNSGTFTTYTFSGNLPTSKLVFIDRNKFYFTSDYYYYLFDNGTFTAYNIPSTETGTGLGLVGNSLYLFTHYSSSSFYQDRVYRIVNDNIILVANNESIGRIHFLKNDVLRITQDSINHSIDYFNGANWINIYNYTTRPYTNWIQYASGGIKEQFFTIWFDSTSRAYCDVYSVNTKYTQTNFPTSAITVAPPMIRTVSNYNDNTYYLIDRYNTTRIVKGKLK